jgi:hypothetical protein
VITTITDPDLANAAQLADCYRQRWESETGFKALKTHQRGPRQILRSHDPDGVNQELYAYLITYQALRQLMHQAAVAADIDPDRLSPDLNEECRRNSIDTGIPSKSNGTGSRAKPPVDEFSPQDPIYGRGLRS